MKFSIGDPVYVKKNDEEGVIDEFIGKDMASVKVNGKSYYVYLEDLEHPYLRWFTKVKTQERKKTPYIDQLSVEKSPKRSSTLSTGIYLVFMPVYKLDGFEEVVEKIKVFLYNETWYTYHFEYLNKVQQETIFGIDSVLEAEQQFYLHDISFEHMAQSPSFYYRFIDHDKPELDNESMLIIKPKKLFEKIDEIKFQNKAFFYFLLFEHLKPRERKEVIVDNSAIKARTLNATPSGHFDFEHALKQSMIEIDLHIEKLVPDHRNMGASEILVVQMKACERALDLAIATHQHSLVIIHGIGKGVLRNEINSLLNQTKGIKRYVNEFDSRYGYGATKVFFR